MFTKNLSLDDYIDDAKRNQKIDSDNGLSFRMGFLGASVSAWRTKRAIPKPESMMKLAKLGGHDPEVALADLGAWQTKGKTRKCYQNIAKKLSAAVALALVFCGIPEPAYAGTLVVHSNLLRDIMYIMANYYVIFVFNNLRCLVIAFSGVVFQGLQSTKCR